MSRLAPASHRALALATLLAVGAVGGVWISLEAPSAWTVRLVVPRASEVDGERRDAAAPDRRVSGGPVLASSSGSESLRAPLRATEETAPTTDAAGFRPSPVGALHLGHPPTGPPRT